MTDKEYWYWLCNIPGIGARKIKHLLDVYREPKQLFFIEPEQLKKIKGMRCADIENWKKVKKNIGSILEQYHNLSAHNIKFVTLEEREYPWKLKTIYDPPAGLYVRGKLPDNKKTTVAIIGARNCTEYGCDMARYFGRELAKAGVQIVSGMAVGVDCNGQKGALEAGGGTFAVLGSGVDVCYPPENISLYMDLQKQGGVLSEFPLGMQGRPHLFPMRNRIISGLSDCIIIIEAREKSGSLITVDQALEQGREIFALPGRITDPLSAGCNRLLRAGASILTRPEDVLEFLQIAYPENKKAKTALSEKKALLKKEEAYVMEFIGSREIHLEALLEKTGMTISILMTILLQLEIKNYVVQPEKNYYIRRYEGGI